MPGYGLYDLDLNVARVCTNKARIYSIKTGLSRFEHDLQNDFHTQGSTYIRLLYGSKYGLVGLLRPCTIKNNFYGPTNFCSSLIPYDLYKILTRLGSLVEWTSCAVVYTVS